MQVKSDNYTSVVETNVDGGFMLFVKSDFVEKFKKEKEESSVVECRVPIPSSFYFSIKGKI
jgi:hypothetical protein